MPKGRTFIYSVWKACERLSIRPPNIKDSWNKLSPLIQAQVLAYSHIRDLEEMELLSAKNIL